MSEQPERQPLDLESVRRRYVRQDRLWGREGGSTKAVMATAASAEDVPTLAAEVERLRALAAPTPLLVLPLPSDVDLTAAVMQAAGDWWRERHGDELVLRFGPNATGPLRQEEHTPYGRALVLREPVGKEVAPSG